MPCSGKPKVVRVEGDDCFRSQSFIHCVERHDVEVDVTSGEAPWQHGVIQRTGRDVHGATGKDGRTWLVRKRQ